MRCFQSKVLILIVFTLSSCHSAESQRPPLDRVALDDTHFEEVLFRNSEQDLALAGMLFLPEGQGSFPAAVIIHGSGTSSRRNGWYLTIAKYLQDRGVAVLLPDKRGSELSAGEWQTASFDDLAGDTLAAIDFLRTRDDIDSSDIGVIGMSQGGQIAPLVALQDPDLAFVVSMSSSSLPMHTGLVYEEKHNIQEIGIPSFISGALAYPAAWSIIYLRQRDFWGAIGNHDSAHYWQKVSVPTLALYGANDTNVNSEQSALVLKSLENPDITVNVYPDSGHVLESPIGQGNNIIREDALLDILNFIRNVDP